MKLIPSSLRLAVSAALLMVVSAAPAFAAGGGGGAVVSEYVKSNYSSMGPVNIPGIAIKNFGVMDGRIYRGEQPRGRDFADLKAIGIDTIIDLRLDAEPNSRHDAEAAGLKYINIPMRKQSTPRDDEAAAFIKAVTDPANGEVYVHCAGGVHRTGSMLAVYRMTQDGWNLDQAYGEMLKFDFYTKWGHQGYKDYVEDFYARLQRDPKSLPVACKAPAPSAVTAAASNQ